MIVTFRDKKIIAAGPWLQIEAIVNAASVGAYDGNIRPDLTWIKGSRVRFTLRNRNSDKRAAFERGVNPGEFRRGNVARRYTFRVVGKEGEYRVERTEVRE